MDKKKGRVAAIGEAFINAAEELDAADAAEAKYGADGQTPAEFPPVMRRDGDEETEIARALLAPPTLHVHRLKASRFVRVELAYTYRPSQVHIFDPLSVAAYSSSNVRGTAGCAIYLHGGANIMLSDFTPDEVAAAVDGARYAP